MPVCEITHSEGMFSLEQKQTIAEQGAKILLEAEGLIDNPFARSICYINFIESKMIYIGGQLDEKGKIVVKVHVFEDAYTDVIKEKLYGDFTKVFIKENNYRKEQNGSNVWCIVVPVGKNNFGVGGRAITLEQTRQFILSYNKN
jgi:hypothetical protein